MWDQSPRMMAAGLGFTQIIGIPGLTTDNTSLSKSLVALAGGTWNTVTCANGQTPQLSNYTSAATPDGIAKTYGQDVYYSDGLPVEFSWPLLPSTLTGSDFAVMLNNGQVITPQVASIYPNFEYNERSVAVLFGHFGNRIDPTKPGALYPVSIAVVNGGTELKLVGPNAKIVSAVGMSAKAPGSPYTDPSVPPDKRGGPRLVGAKLSVMSTVGDTGPKAFDQNLPNDGVTLYGDQAQYRLRVYTTGGMTPDGVRGMYPTDFSRFFKLVAKSDNGNNVAIVEANHDYTIDGQSLRVVGLADLGKKQDSYDDCYGDDKDNYIDIVLSGSKVAVSKITTVYMPSTGKYSPVYNPGGPGNNPAPGVRYSAPSAPISQPVTNALDDPLTVTYPADAKAE